MPALFIFLFKVNIALLLFCAGYYFVLRRLTFYSLNRVYLVTAILFASVYPKIDLAGFAKKHEDITGTVQNAILNLQLPAQNVVKQIAHPDYWLVATIIFWLGAAFLFIRLAIQLLSLLKLYHESQPDNLHGHNIRVISGKAAPFSFWRSIYINPANHKPEDIKAILLHEQVHVKGWHSIDILIAELSSIFYWFNPGIWLIKKAVRENIEFITDRKILNKGFDSKAYQYSLLNVSFNNSTPGIVNHFNISTIKKRIIMMNTQRSSNYNLTRYVLIIPAVTALLLVFTLTKAEVAKPISIRLNHAIKPVTLALKKATINTIAKADTIVTQNFRVLLSNEKKIQKFNIKLDTLRLSKDTAKRVSIILTDHVAGTDSMNFVLNGKKINSTEFKTIDPTQIEAINIVSADGLDNLLGPDRELRFENKNKVVFITTKGSEEGKKLLEKLGHKRQITDIVITGRGNLSHTVNGLRLNRVKGDTLRLDGNSNMLYTVQGQLKPIKPDVVVQGYKMEGDQVYISRSDKNLDPIKINGKASLNAVTVKGYKLSTDHVVGVNYNSGVNRISDKLIIIDGKEATIKDLKKLSAFDIDRMNIATGADTIKKYGDKAKYGVVYIYTKKSK
ncbi:M56 family metallopeptidase [Mucilaginibacter segetis]|uniref:M56 family metallopeptidase n=1 Tax=Mucilaginibacter segetis TaxID=2793071 RepID=A0A934PTV3_9SPHI|nr:M56 family metallopeptidase [Mucilaginibacter segetis]MBK0378965.1 M56 family metallopeptidase [Mucilaginibacter segetis]